MRLSTDTHKQVEEFLRATSGDPHLRFPPIRVYGGRLSRLLTKTFKIGAITIGRHIVVSPNLMERDGEGRVRVPGWLLAHEGTHVMQYEQAGLFRFLRSYLREYWQSMRKGKWTKEAHKEAYLNLSTEVAARAAEEAYAAWRAAMREEKEVASKTKPQTNAHRRGAEVS